MIQRGNTVEVHYTGKLTNGEIFDSSIGGEALEFEVGSGQIIAGFENAIIGKTTGDKVTVNIEPADAYGEFNEELVVELPLNQVPENPQVGQVLEANTPDGQIVAVTIEKVNEDTITINANHPLAGKELIFDIEIVNFK